MVSQRIPTSRQGDEPMTGDVPESEIDRSVQRIRLYKRVGYWLSQGVAIFSFAAFGLTILWAALGMQQSHWSYYLMGGAYVIGTLLLIAGLVVARRENALSDGNCHKCGGEINGRPPDDWVMECEDCGQEWVLAGEYGGDLY
jgi:hypothetical protein